MQLIYIILVSTFGYGSVFQTAKETIQSHHAKQIRLLEQSFINSSQIEEKIDYAHKLIPIISLGDEKLRYYYTFISQNSHLTKMQKIRWSEYLKDKGLYAKSLEVLDNIHDKKAIEIKIKCSFELKKFKEISKIYKSSKFKKKLSRDALLMVAHSWRSTEKSLKLFEFLANDYPLDHPSIEAFHTLEGLESFGKYRFSTKLIKSIHRNVNFAPGLSSYLSEFVLSEEDSQRKLSSLDRYRLTREKSPKHNSIVVGRLEKWGEKVEYAKVLRKYGNKETSLRVMLDALREKPRTLLKKELLQNLNASGLKNTAFHFIETIKSSKSYRLWNKLWMSLELKQYQIGRSILDERFHIKDKNFGSFKKYWKAVFENKLLKPGNASELLKDAFKKDPLSYYGLMAHMKLNELEIDKELIDQMSKEFSFNKKRQSPVMLRKRYPRAYANSVYITARHYSLDPYLLMSLIKAESQYNPHSVSWVGARGLMQVMPKTAFKIASLVSDFNIDLEKLHRPSTNILYGGYYLNRMIKYYGGNEILGIAAYNAGPIAVNRWLQKCQKCSIDAFVEKIPYKETRRYVKKVTGYFRKYYYIYQNKLETFKTIALPKNLPQTEELF